MNSLAEIPEYLETTKRLHNDLIDRAFKAVINKMLKDTPNTFYRSIDVIHILNDLKDIVKR